MSPSEIRVRATAGSVERAGRPIPVNPREKALLFTLVAARRPLTRAELHAALWPDLESDAARNCLGVCIHRLRRQLGDAGAVVRTFAGYALGPNCSVDLWDAEDLDRRVRHSGVLTPAERAQAHALFASLLHAAHPALVPQYEHLAGFAVRAESVRRNIGLRLAADALTLRDPADALRCAAAVLESDPCDEAACELAMRAHLMHDDRGSAIREYRTYQRIVANELDLQPSAHLRAMLSAC
jgi:DNA-binding SARP family transcriptional activator